MPHARTFGKKILTDLGHSQNAFVNNLFVDKNH
jgi:hypothetical protein